MLNEDKIRLMTGIAMYEKKAEKDGGKYSALLDDEDDD